jgi:cytoskeletal protein CcmA (bactofilin family)
MSKKTADWSFSSESSPVEAGRIPVAQGSLSGDRSFSTTSSRSLNESKISAGTVFKGIVNFEGPSRIDGSLEGELSCSAELVVGEQGSVRANIKASVVKVFGKVRGDIAAADLIELFAGSQVNGSLSSPRVVMHDGVVFEGHCRMENSRRGAQPTTSSDKDISIQHSIESSTATQRDLTDMLGEGTSSSRGEDEVRGKTFRD